MGEIRCVGSEVSAGRQRRVEGDLEWPPGNIQQYEILVRKLCPRSASITKSPVKYGKFCSSCRVPTLFVRQQRRGQRAEQDCPRGKRPASMAIGFQRKHHPSERAA